MDTLNTDALIYYIIFSVFVFYQQLHVRNFRGSSQGFQTLLSFSAFAGMVAGIVFLIYYAIQISVTGALIIFGAGLLTAFFGPLFEKIFGAHTLSLFGFVAWPICAYMMFTSI